MPETILEEAGRLVDGPRAKSYGHPAFKDATIASLWSAILGFTVKPEHVPLCMIAFKMARELNKHDRDNIVDIAGYARTLEMHHEHSARLRSRHDEE